MTVEMKSLVCSNPAVVKDFLVDLRDLWNRNGIVWAMMSGWDGLPGFVRHDLDIIVSKGCRKEAVSMLKESAKKNGWRLFGVFKEGRPYSSYYFVKHIDTINEDAFLQFDLFTSFRRHNVEVVDLQEALDNRWLNDNGFWCVSEGWRGAFLIIKELLSRGVVEGEQRYSQMRDSLSKCRDVFISSLAKFCNSRNAAATVDAIESGDYKLSGFRKIYKRAYVKRVLRHPIAFIIGLAGYSFGCVVPFKRLFIAFIGPDGCGKTTIADEVQERFYKHPFAAVWRVKSGFGPLPRLRDVKAKLRKLITGKETVFKAEPDAGTRHMGMQKPHSRMQAMFYVAYYGISQIFGWMRFCRFSPSLPCMVIADRYYYDYYYQLVYSKCPTWWIHIFAAFIPKPDVLFVLRREAEDIYSKKPELTVEEIDREQRAIDSSLAGLKCRCDIDASNGVDATVSSVADRIMEWIAA